MGLDCLTLPLEAIKLEPEVVGTDQKGRHQVNPEHMLMSIAISLKRIADTFEETFQTTDHHGRPVTFMDLLSSIANRI